MGAPGAQLSSENVEFFESRIRPVLAQDCYECHETNGKAKGGLVLDHRAGLLAGGDSGAVVIPGRPEESLLIKAVRHETDDLKMPKAGVKLEAEVVADLVRWIEMGAPDPRDEPPSAAEVAEDRSWEAVRERRKQWWSFQPVVEVVPPEGTGWDHPVDRFIGAKLDEAGLEAGGRADRLVLMRRLSYALTGMPPTVAEMDAFLADKSEDAYAKLVDRLLASPRYGERWARHWMDWVRFAETHGSEGDAPIPFAWQYRDYLVRALNADVPYDQLLREHLAGDLLDEPRIDLESGINESTIGPAHFRMVFHGFKPTDALLELVRFTDDQIDVVSKAFQGLTVSCARCHDHKFDPISQADYYALFGIFASARPGQVAIDEERVQERHQGELRDLKRMIQLKLAEAWEAVADGIVRDLENPTGAWAKEFAEAGEDKGHPLYPWVKWRHEDHESFSGGWAGLRSFWEEKRLEEAQRREVSFGEGWNLGAGGAGEWFFEGNGLSGGATGAGAFRVLPMGERVIDGIYPAGVYTHLLSDRHRGILGSPRFKIEGDAISIRLLGGQDAQARLVVQNYPISQGGIYGMVAEPKEDEMRWYTWDTSYWKGDHGHIEVATRDDRMAKRGGKGTSPKTDGRSFFGVAEVVFHEGDKSDKPVRIEAPVWGLLTGEAPGSGAELGERYREILMGCIEAWRDGEMTDEEAAFLGFFVRRNLVPTTMAALPEVAPLVATYRRFEGEVPIPRRVPGLLEATAFDQPMFERGDHQKAGEAVPRGFLEVMGGEPYETSSSGRLELANDMLRPDNPLTSRLVVNRLWHYLFGRGLCATVDNFGRMGEKPTHPELLDYLAKRFVDEGWSIKEMIRFLVTSETYRRASEVSPEAAASDPSNEMLSHFNVMRLDGEAIRDGLLAVSGQLDETMGGPGIDPVAPPSKSRRRSVYLTIRRNRLNPLLGTFDAPEPVSTKGRRNVTNVPGQSLTMLNDPFITEQAERWAEKMAATEDVDGRIDLMFRAALGRGPSREEREAAKEYMKDTERGRAAKGRPGSEIEEGWQDLAHAIFNLKEFIYIK